MAVVRLSMREVEKLVLKWYLETWDEVSRSSINMKVDKQDCTFRLRIEKRRYSAE